MNSFDKTTLLIYTENHAIAMKNKADPQEGICRKGALSPVPSACGGAAPELSRRESQETLSPVPSACGGAAPELSQRESQESM